MRELRASYPAFKQELVTRQSRKNVHANTRFTKQNCALSHSVHVSTEERTSQTSQDVSACRVTLESAAKKVLKAVMVCMRFFSCFRNMKWAIVSRDFSKNQAWLSTGLIIICGVKRFSLVYE